MSDDSPRQTRPWPLILMVGILSAVILAGLVLRPHSDEDKLRWLELLGTTNQGELINPPLTIPGDLFITRAGEDWAALDNAHWKLVVVNEGVCSLHCEQLIYTTRQVHSRLNRRAPLLERALLNFGDSGLSMAQLTESYPELQLLRADRATYESWISGSNLEGQDRAVILLINPIDVVQLFYTGDHDGNGLLEDLEHLMRLAN